MVTEIKNDFATMGNVQSILRLVIFVVPWYLTFVQILEVSLNFFQARKKCIIYVDAHKASVVYPLFASYALY